ncbi:MAG: FtsX-like permease family protein [Clostridia bacterium]|nr:FtsX-like permease family protein [Clostridia bacterium]
MNKTIFKDMIMEIKHTYKRFISILLIILLGSGFFAGIKSVSPDMKIAADNYLDESEFMDFKLISTFGIDDEDIEAIKNEKEVEKVMPTYSVDVLMEQNEKEFVLKLMSLPFLGEEEYINQLQLIDGRLPRQVNECVTEQKILDNANLKLGDKIKISDKSFDDTTKNLLSIREYTIVGIVNSPVYLSFDRGTTNLGSGSINGFVYVSNSSIHSDYYTEAYVTVKGARNLKCFEEDYEKLISEEKEKLETLARARKDETYNTIVEEYNAKIQQGEEELETFKTTSFEKIEEARNQIDEARSQIETSEASLDEQESQIQKQFLESDTQMQAAWDVYYQKEAEFNEKKASIEAQIRKLQNSVVQGAEGLIANLNNSINTSNQTIASKKSELATKQSQLNSKQSQLNSKQNQLNTINSQISTKQSQISAKNREIQSKEAEITSKEQQVTEKTKELMYNWWNAMAINAEIAKLRGEIFSLRNQITVLNNEISKLNSEITSLNTQKNTLTKEISSLNSEITLLKSQIATLNSQIEAENKKIALYQSQLNALNDKLNSSSPEIGILKTTLEIAQTELNNIKNELNNRQAELNSAKSEATSEIERARQEINTVKTELDEKEKQLNDEELNVSLMIADAELELEEQKERLAEIKRPEWYVLDREKIESYASYFQDADRIGAVAKVFPVIFFIVAALVSLTSMTRMIEEQRSQIGTMKALGYERKQIMSKYLCYSLIATLIGCIIGIVLGVELLPRIVFSVYSIMYNIPKLVIQYNYVYILTAVLLSITCTCGATAFVCWQSLKEVPATLMRPKSPKTGKRIFLEKMPFIWKRINFSNKVTARNIFRYKKRFLMTVIGIGGCTALLLTGFGLREAITSMVPTQYREIFTYNLQISYKDKVSEEDKSKFEEELIGKYGVKSFIRGSQIAMEFEANDITKSGFLLVATNSSDLSEYVNLRNRETKEQCILDNDNVIITEKLAKLLNVKEGDTIIIRNIDNEEVEVNIAAISENYILHYVCMSSELYEKLYDRMPKYNNLLVKSDEFTEEEEEENLKQILDNDMISSAQYSRGLTKSIVEAMNSLDSVVYVLIVSAGALAFVVLYNLSNINIGERMRELATIKVLGFYDKEVEKYVYKENVLLTIIGIAVGIIMGYFLNSYVVTTCEVDLVMFTRELSWTSILMAIVITIIFAWIVNFVTRFSLKKIDMIESLKSIE